MLPQAQGTVHAKWMPGAARDRVHWQHINVSPVVAAMQIASPVRLALSRRPRLAALVLVLAFLLASAACTCVWLGLDQLRQLESSHERANTVAAGIIDETRDLLRTLNAHYQPECSNANLLELRKELFAISHVGDIGVLDSTGHLLCTTTTGMLDRTYPPLVPDIYLMNRFGERYGVNFNVSILVGKVPTRAVILRAGLFNVVMRPSAWRQLAAAGVSALKVLTAQDRLSEFYQSPELSPGWRKWLLQADAAQQDATSYQWGLGAFVAVRHVQESRFILQSVVPLERFLLNYRSRLLMTALLLSLIGMLLYGELKSRFVLWQDLRWRIDGLLQEKNLVCMYQPIVHLQSQQVVGCEVLMRLRDGGRLLYPDQLLPAVIECRQTWTLDQLVVRVGVAELYRHLPALRGFKVAFNFFPGNVSLAKVHGAVSAALALAPHEGLVFNVEVIEQHYEGGVVQEIAALRAKNYQISVDDFGTGYSNLGSIKSISPDFLKIDKSFVFDMEEATIRSSLIPEIINIARAVNARLIAEGIENESQRALLQSLGVDYGQGYYFARPMEIADFAVWLQGQSVAQRAPGTGAVAEPGLSLVSSAAV